MVKSTLQPEIFCDNSPFILNPEGFCRGYRFSVPVPDDGCFEGSVPDPTNQLESATQLLLQNARHLWTLSCTDKKINT